MLNLLPMALLESFTVHARILLDFLFAENPREDDVIAEDYFQSGKIWLKERGNKSNKLESIHKRVGKEVAHLTYTRQTITTDMKVWNFIEIASEINTVFNAFLTHVQKNHLSARRYVTEQKIEPTEPTVSFYIYENWVAEGHKARIHFGHCSYCKFGHGIHETTNERNGRWLGPYNTLQEALVSAQNTGGVVSKCKHCNPS